MKVRKIKKLFNRCILFVPRKDFNDMKIYPLFSRNTKALTFVKNHKQYFINLFKNELEYGD